MVTGGSHLFWLVLGPEVTWTNEMKDTGLGGTSLGTDDPDSKCKNEGISLAPKGEKKIWTVPLEILRSMDPKRPVVVSPPPATPNNRAIMVFWVAAHGSGDLGALQKPCPPSFVWFPGQHCHHLT